MPHTAGQPAISRQWPPSRNLLSSTRQVCARPSEGEGFAGHCSDGTLLSVYGLMLLLASCRRRVRLIRTCPVGTQESELESEGYERPALPREPGQHSNAFTGHFDPSSSPHRQNPCSRFAVDSLASQRPECQRCQSELECSQQPPALLGPRLGQTCRLANRAWPIAAGSIGPGGRGEGGINQRAGTPRLAT